MSSPTSQAPAPAAAPVSIADPAPLGLAAFAMTTLVLSVFNTNMLDSKLSAAVLPLALAYGGGAQLLAGMWEFRRGNTFGATAFSSYGAFWLSYYFLVKDILPAIGTDPQTHNAVGLYLLAWGIFTAYMAVCALRVSGAVLGVFVFLAITFVVLAIGSFLTNGTTVTQIGGWFGIVTALIAWYTSFAGVAESTFGKPVLPVWPATRS